MPDADGIMGTDLRATAERAAKKNAVKSAAAEKLHKDEREARIEAAARKFLDARTEHLPELLRQAAKAGRFEHEVWQRELSHLPHGSEEIEAVRRGMRYVAAWLKERGIEAHIDDDGGESIPDYGYVHTVRLKARWG